MQQTQSLSRLAITAGLVISLLLLAACSNTSSSRYQQRYDSAPEHSHDVGNVPDAVPRVEARSRGGNKSPYRVFGKQYWVMPSSLGYAETGTASWYGSKFHGHQTSNGEIYNMFSMTAAHKSLPIPTYVKVTNLSNGRHVIVRVNDRGPFHEDRIIDLSYAAATKLGYANKGTAQVRVEAIDPIAWQQNKAQPAAPAPLAVKPTAIAQVKNESGDSHSQVVTQRQPSVVAGNTRSVTQTLPNAALEAGDKIFLQVGAFANFDSAKRLQNQLRRLTGNDVVIYLDQRQQPNLHKVHIGPVADVAVAQQLRELIGRNGYGAALILSLPKL